VCRRVLAAVVAGNTREQSFEPGEIHRCVRKALAMVDGDAEPLVLALVCIAIGMMVGEQTSRAIIKDGYRAAKGMRNEA
jgi:hypothetical protein